MDLDEWEFLPDSKTFMDFGHEGGGKEMLRKELSFDDKLILEMNYFICPPKPAAHSSRHRVGDDDDSGGDRSKSAVFEQATSSDKFKDIDVVLPPPVFLDSSDVVSQVFFRKMKENEFADMKVTSPRSCGRGFTLPHPEPEPIQLGEEEEKVYDLDPDAGQKPPKEVDLGATEGSDVKRKHGLDGLSVSIWRWKLTGVGALCSIGVAAAATICCILVLGGRQRQKQQQHHHQKIQLQIYADEKRIKHAVHQATRLNHALSAARGAHMTRANISFGGYYEGL